MSKARSAGGSLAGSSSGAGAGRSRPGARALLGVVATLLVASGWLLPLWRARLLAPQYPGGLTMNAYGHGVTGDVDEINALNHYVGLGVFDPADVPEMQLWPLALGVAVLAVVLAVLVRRRWLSRVAAAYLWLLPLGVLAAIQLRLHEFGHQVEPGAAFRIEPFTPWVVGKTTVWNFETWAWPGWGLLAILAAAALVTFGPRLLTTRPGGPSPALGAVVLAVALALGPTLAGTPALAQGPHDHGHDPGPAHGTLGEAGPPAPLVGPPEHHDMPTVVPHPIVGDLADELAAVPAGGTLTLAPGSYRGPVVIDEPVVIEGHGLPIIVGDGTGSVLTVRAPGTVIRDVVVRGSGPGPTGDPAGIRIEADDVTVERVVVEDSYAGIAVDSASAVKLVDNHIHGRAGAAIVDEGHAVADDESSDVDDGASDVEHAAHVGGDAHDGHGDHGHAAASGSGGSRGDGIWLHDVDHVLVRGNHISHVRDGVYVSFGSGALLDGNHVRRSRYAVHTMFARELSVVQNHFSGNLSGTVLMYGADVLLLRNEIVDNTSSSTGFGMILKDIAGVEAVQNVLARNRIAVHIDGPTEATFTANTLARNAVGVQAHSASVATFAGNSFADNAIQALALGGRLGDVAWSADGWGNFWSSYRGYDANGEGRGALAHTEGGSVDRLLSRNPELLAIADGPALRLLRSIEERWGNRDPVLTDELPLTVPVSPALSAPTAPPATALAAAAAAALMLPGLALFWRPRRHAIIRRQTRVVTV